MDGQQEHALVAYGETRHAITSGDLLAWRGGSAVSRLIRHVTGESYSHVGIAWRFRGRVFVLEAREGAGVQIRALSQCLPCDWVSVATNWTDEVETLALEHLGRPYCYSDTVRTLFGFDPSHAGEICSVYAASVLAHASVAIPTIPYVPGSLVNAVLDAGGVLRALKQDSAIAQMATSPFPGRSNQLSDGGMPRLSGIKTPARWP